MNLIFSFVLDKLWLDIFHVSGFIGYEFHTRSQYGVSSYINFFLLPRTIFTDLEFQLVSRWWYQIIFIYHDSIYNLSDVTTNDGDLVV